MGYERDERRYARGEEYGPRSQRSDYGRAHDRAFGRERGDHERGFFERASDEVRSWFGDEEAERRRRYDERFGAPPSYREPAGGRDVPRERGEVGYGRDTSYGYNRDVPRGYDPYYNADSFGLGGSYYTGGTYRERQGPDSTDTFGHDPSYRSWRDRQMETLDRDYADYRRQHQSKFENDFGNWRQQREMRRGHLGKVREQMEVEGSDGQHLGTVDHVRNDRIILTKQDKDAGGRHHSIPLDWVDKVDDKVRINRDTASARSAWRDEERGALFGNRDDSDGPHILNKSFSGTY